MSPEAARLDAGRKSLCRRILLMRAAIPLALAGLLASCGSRKAAVSSGDAYDFMFGLYRYAETGRTDIPFPDRFFFPEDAVLLWGRSRPENGTIMTFAERLNPSVAGISWLDGLYVPDADSAAWVDSSVNLQEEALKAGGIITEMEKSLEVTPPFSGTGADDAFSGENPVSPEERFMASTMRLALMRFGGEVFVPSGNSDFPELIQYYDGNAVRTFSDALFRTLRREYWKIDDFVSGHAVRTDTFTYTGDSAVPASAEVTADGGRVVTEFSGGLPVHVSVYEPVPSADVGAEDGEFLARESFRSYTADGKLEAETVVSRGYGPDGEESVSKRTERFIHGADGSAPDYEYYEDGILRMRTVRSEDGSYASEVFFDGGNSVTAYYEQGRKVRDVYKSGGEIRRVREYE